MEKPKVTVVVGGFFGDEGKGRIVAYLALKDNPNIIVRAGGGPQAGHTIEPNKKVTQLPSGLVNPNSRLLIARGTVIDPKIVLQEIGQYDAKYKVGRRLGIDYGCTIIEPKHVEAERELVSRIGSVGKGIGPARVDRLLRTAKLAKDCPGLKPFLTDVALEVNKSIGLGQKILIEGVQGFGLSLLDYRFYPYVTTQDTTASQFAADIGIGPRAIDEIVVVYKAYVSRVAKGPMRFEWDAEKVKQHGIEERGTVSGRLRRLGDFDQDLALESLIRNTGTMAAITCIDRLFPGNTSIREFDKLTQGARDFLKNLMSFFEKNTPTWLGFKGITLISTGPSLNDMIDLIPSTGN
jgi:adenylosuccinate synthase